MGWFWADAPAHASQIQTQHGTSSQSSRPSPPKGCPMHQKTVDAFNPSSKCKNPESSTVAACPVPHSKSSTSDAEPRSLLSQLNPLNLMFRDLSNAPAPDQKVALPTDRECSTIPKGSGDGTWEYPSPQQMYHALLRKGHTDTDPTAVESMVSVHNFLNEGAWAEIVRWERRFGRGLVEGWRACSQGEERADYRAMASEDGSEVPPTLVRFQGRPGEMTPKAALLQMLGRVYPSKFGTEPPFDRHDWYVSRMQNGEATEIRYVIDYYSGPPEPTGEPVFYLDVRPAFTPTGASERFIRWGCDLWWRATGGVAREKAFEEQKKKGGWW